MASPHVAGAAALYIESHPNAAPSEVLQHLKDSAISQTQTCDSKNKGGYKQGPNGPIVGLLNIEQINQDSSLNLLINENSKAPEINILQRMLTLLGYNPGLIDGKFGPKTEAAVKQFQQDDGLTVDGIVRADVWAAMFSKIPFKLTDSTGPITTGLDPTVEDTEEMHLSILSAIENLNSSINNLTKTIQLNSN